MRGLHLLVLGCVLTLAQSVQAQVPLIDDNFDNDPCSSGDWDCLGATRWVDPAAQDCCPDPPDCLQAAGAVPPDCNFYPGEGWVLVTPATTNQAGHMFRREPTLYDNFRMTAVVELRGGTITTAAGPADGMTIVIIGTPAPPPIGCGGGAMGATGLGAAPTMVFEFDNWDCNPPGDINPATGQNDDNHVAFTYSPVGYACGALPSEAFAHVDPLLNNLVAEPAPANRFTFTVQVKQGLVTCDLANEDIGMAKTRMYTYTIPNLEPFEGFLGVTAATGNAWQNHMLHSVKIEDVTGACLFPPGAVSRKITNTNRTDDLALYSEGDVLQVNLELKDIREFVDEDPDCGPPNEVTLSETPPDGWTVSNITPPGTFSNGTINWVLTGAAVTARTVSYRVTAGSADEYRKPFRGIIQETNVPGSDIYGFTGDQAVFQDAPISQVEGKRGWISQWLLLGPYNHVGFDAPGQINMHRDYLTDGAAANEFDALPRHGDTVNTSFTASASTGYVNPRSQTPTWQSYAKTSQADPDTIDLNSLFGVADPNNVMAYAVAYVNNTTGGPLDALMETASDDSIQVLIGRCPVLSYSIPRGSGGSGNVQDRTEVTLAPGMNRVMVKVWEGGGGWSFRLRFTALDGTPLEPPAIVAALRPDAFGPASLPNEGCPVAIISSPKVYGKAPFQASLGGERSFGRPGRAITTFEWDFGDGGAGAGVNATHSYSTPGDYPVTLRVTDSGGSQGTATRFVHVFAGGIIVDGPALDTLALAGIAEVSDTSDGIRTYVSPAGDDLNPAQQSSGDMALEITSLGGETEFPVAILLRNQGDHSAGLTISQRTTGVTSNVAFGSFNPGDMTNTHPQAMWPNVLARDNTARENVAATYRPDPVDPSLLNVGDVLQRTEDPALADAYAPFAYAFSGEAKLRLAEGRNLLRLDNRRPGASFDNGNQVAAIIIGPDSPGLQGRTIACPATPAGLVARPDPGFCMINLTWDANSQRVQGYNLYRSLVSGGPYERIASGLTGTAYTDTNGAAGLERNKRYYYKITASLEECESAQSSFKNALTGLTCNPPPEPPGAPVNLVATGGPRRVNLNWSAPTTGSASTAYAVLRSDAPGGPYSQVASVDAPTTTYIDPDLAENTQYCYQVRARAGTLEGGTSDEKCARTLGGGLEPTFRRGNVNGDTLLDISDAIGILGYLFLGQADKVVCVDAADIKDKGSIDISDAISVLNFLFQGGTPPAAPGPNDCGEDPIKEVPDLGCAQGC